MDGRKVSRLERVRGQRRIAVHQGRTPDSHHALLGDRIDRYFVLSLLRLRECERDDLDEGGNQKLGPCKVPSAFTLFPKDISHPPREWAQRFFNVQRWTEMPQGGHFAAMEEPELLARNIREWFRAFRN